jgi:hypothetical protein
VVDTTSVGASGTVRGVVALDTDEYVPTPTEFTAATRNTYVDPFRRPVTANEVDVDPVSTAVDQLEPPLDEYCTE